MAQDLLYLVKVSGKNVFLEILPIHILLYYFLAHDRMSVASLCNPDLSVVVSISSVGVVVIVIVICEHSS